MWTYISTNEIYHHGVKGQKWGVRRYQNSDGSLTAAGKKRAAQQDESSTQQKPQKPKKQHVSELSDAEIRARIQRVQLEKQYRELLEGEKAARVAAGQRKVDAVLKYTGLKLAGDVAERALTNVATQALTYILGSSVNKVAKNNFGVKGNMINTTKK